MVRVVGTNGKGTVTAMIAAGLQADGERVGRFLSPHVEDFRERIALGGKLIDSFDVAEFVAKHRETPPDDPELSPAFFEWTLALALERFELCEVAWGVFEAGVGGASDATQVLNGPALRLVVLTNVTEDHLDTLGPTLKDVARDKAGAAATGVPLLTAAQGAALKVVEEVAYARGAELHVVDPPPGSSTRGANEALASAALTLLGRSSAALSAARALAPLPGRGERFLVGDRLVVLDGAHDPAAASRLAAEHTEAYTLLFGALARKQATATLAQLAGRADAVVLTAAAEGDIPPSAPPGLATRTIPDPLAALETALELTKEGGTLLIAGSLYLAGRLRGWLAANGTRVAQPEM